VVVGISFVFLPVVINSVNPVVNNTPYATAQIQQFLVQHPQSVAFAQAHAPLLAAIKANQSVVDAVSANPSAANVAAALNALALPTSPSSSSTRPNCRPWSSPIRRKLNYLSANQAHLNKLQQGLAKSPDQWKRWFWVDFGGMVLFIPLIFLTKGRWSPRRAKEDADEHERAVAAELARIASEGARCPRHPADPLGCGIITR